MIPASTQQGSIPFIDALFTSASAVCVTGLVVVDTGSCFTRTGQLFLLCLIQLGGLGIMTFSVLMLLVSGRRVPIRDKLIVQSAFVPSGFTGIHALVKRLVLTTFVLEGLGTLLLWLFAPDRTWFASIFHAVSAFCNAGLALKASSFVDYRYNIGFNLTICALIILGGLGFVTHMNLTHLFRRRPHFRLSLHSRLVLTVTAALVFGGALSFCLFETRNTLRLESLRGILLISLFQSVTTRTAGFNTIDINSLTNATIFGAILLMFIGASPGSTGGGVKTTTLGVLLAMARSRYRGEEHVHVFRRSIPTAAVSKALSVTVLGFTLITFAVLLLSLVEIGTEPHGASPLRFVDILFEVVSAFGTVGLSTGITRRLSSAGKFILVLVMFVGRIGPLTIATLVGRSRAKGKYRYAEENVMVG